MRNKKILGALLAVTTLATFGLAGCGNSGSNGAASKENYYKAYYQYCHEHFRKSKTPSGFCYSCFFLCHTFSATHDYCTFGS